LKKLFTGIEKNKILKDFVVAEKLVIFATRFKKTTALLAISSRLCGEKNSEK